MNKKEYLKQYYEKNKTKLNTNMKEYYKKNASTFKKHNEEYNKENREDNLERMKKYYIKNKYNFTKYKQDNRKVILQQHKEYYIKNKNKIRTRKKYYIQSSPLEKRKRYIRAKTIKHFPLEGIKCLFCKEAAKVHHHITEPMEYDKYFPLDSGCHKKIHDTSFLTLMKGGNKK